MVEAGTLHPETNVGAWVEKFENKRLFPKNILDLVEAIYKDTQTEGPEIVLGKGRARIIRSNNQNLNRLEVSFNNFSGQETVEMVSFQEAVTTMKWFKQPKPGETHSKNLNGRGLKGFAQSLISAYLDTPHPLGE